MSVKNTLLGIAVLAVLAAGAWWARSPSAPAKAASAVEGASVRAVDNEALPDVTHAAGSADAGEGVRLTLSVTPNPPVAMAKTRVRVRAESNGAPVAIENGRISFEMVMPMGDHRYTLLPSEEGWLEAAVVLPT